ncbi:MULTISPECIES: DUF167 family protein [unclassified Nitratiruptor]|uniref:DUF167 domain-containing protein n=1 Tax=unclassified Nitratiruptor TaxID=2624044 RepID=UPI0019152931|nr:MULTISPECIES: DUF167 family protein [unclassified Nitratiruptor]BCD60810.1 hypothetical protein NitYY0810_C1588 [Nitratiruptor sp. YY08-10]BCD64742.1 hypothetical protein NitYY0814_C1596 [Nitratiruptor sp. YY08-14]
MWYKIEDDQVHLFIKAQPNASKNKIAGILGDSLKIAIKAPAVEGAANKELVKFLSKTFKVAKSDIVFASGETSKRKHIVMPYNKKIDDFIKELTQ